MNSLHFLRPWCFVLLLPLIGLLLLFWQRRLASQSWRNVVDPGLLPHLLQGATSKISAWPVFWLGLWFMVAVVAMAGPVWKQVEQPVFRSSSALVVVLDLSQSMNAEDIAPSRLERVKLKLLDILEARQEGQTGLLVYAAHPFVFSPLTEDRATIGLQVKTLETSLMPAQGSRPDRALDRAVELLSQAGVVQGEILLITDGISGGDPEAIGARVRPHRLSVLGVGTPEGAPIPTDGQGFFKDSIGAIVLARLQETELDVLARLSGGRYHRLSGDDRDIQFLLPSMQSAGGEIADEDGARTDQWQEEGPWLALLLLPFAALMFRRGIFSLVLVGVLSQVPPSYAFEWRDLWSRKDQQGARAMGNDAPEAAAELFTDQEWQAAANYQAGNYERTLEFLQGDDSQAPYNRGNALARLGKLDEALNAYEEAIENDSDNEDARYNHKLVKELLEQQQQQNQQQQQGDKQGEQGEQKKDQKQQQGGEQGNENKQQEQEQSKEGEGVEDARQEQSDEGRQGQQPEEGQQGREEESQGESPQEQEQKAGASEETDEASREVKAERDQADGESGQEAQAAAAAEADQEEKDAERQEVERLLRGIPDDPGGLWRRKFKYQYDRQYRQQGEEKQQW